MLVEKAKRVGDVRMLKDKNAKAKTSGKGSNGSCSSLGSMTQSVRKRKSTGDETTDETVVTDKEEKTLKNSDIFP